MVKFVIASMDDMELLMQIRLEMLRAVNELSSDYVFSNELIDKSREYFEDENQTTVLAVDGSAIGCVTICYIKIMPTFLHPTGIRAHLMNVYVNSEYRRQGIALQMLDILMKEAKEKGVTEIKFRCNAIGKTII